jgi:hypothetical protein
MRFRLFIFLSLHLSILLSLRRSVFFFPPYESNFTRPSVKLWETRSREVALVII